MSSDQRLMGIERKEFRLGFRFLMLLGYLYTYAYLVAIPFGLDKTEQNVAFCSRSCASQTPHHPPTFSNFTSSHIPNHRPDSRARTMRHRLPSSPRPISMHPQSSPPS